MQQTDSSAPVPHGPFEYYHRTVEGSQYAIHCRRPRGGGAEQVVIDVNELAAGHSFMEIGDLELDPTHAIAAYTIDTNGGERYELRFRDLGSGTDLADTVPDVYYGLAWADDSRTIFYVRPDAAMRPVHGVAAHARQRSRGRRARLPRRRRALRRLPRT